MAHPIPFKEANGMLYKPEGWSSKDCSDLEVARGRMANGDPFVISRWQLEERDIEALKQNGCKLYLVFYGVTHAPVIVMGESPFEQTWLKGEENGA